MTDPFGAPLTPATTLEAPQVHAAALTVCDRTDTLGWPRSDTLAVLRALGLVADVVPAPSRSGKFEVRP